jgi:hypothetical protein
MDIGSGTPRDLVKDDVRRKLTEAGIDACLMPLAAERPLLLASHLVPASVLGFHKFVLLCFDIIMVPNSVALSGRGTSIAGYGCRTRRALFLLGRGRNAAQRRNGRL